MPTYEAVVRVVYVETWSVEARDEADARRKMSELTEDVDDDATSGEVVDWEVYEIKEVSQNAEELERALEMICGQSKDALIKMHAEEGLRIVKPQKKW